MRLAYLTTDENPYFFPEDMFYSAPAPRYVEGWIWNRTKGKTLALTIEMPYSYYNENPENEWVTLESQKKTGNTFYGRSRIISTGMCRAGISWKEVSEAKGPFTVINAACRRVCDLYLGQCLGTLRYGSQKTSGFFPLCDTFR